jgi:hypothetical protein
LTAAALHLDNVDLLATLLENATVESRCPDDPSYDMP